MAPPGAQPAAIGSAGLALGGLLLFLASRRARKPVTFQRAERRLLALGGLAVAGYPLTFYPAVAAAGVAVATVIALGSAPAFAGLLAWCTGHGRPSRRWAGATLAATAGCTLLVAGPQLTGHGSRAPVPVMGIVLAATAGLSYAVYSLIGAKLIARGHPSSQVMGRMFGVGSLLVLPVLASGGTHWLATVRGTAVALHLAVFTTFVAYRLFGHGLRGICAQTATTLTLAEPAVATVLGVGLLGEHLPVVSLAGMAILAAGLAVLAIPAPARTGVFRWHRRLPGPRGSSSAPSRDCAPPACTRRSAKPAGAPRTCAAPALPGTTGSPATRACR
jgi:DME family drug/metabolite transporter